MQTACGVLGVKDLCTTRDYLKASVPTPQNLADLPSRGGVVGFEELWEYGPEQMSDRKCWPDQQVIQACGASREEIEVQREVVAIVVDTTDRLDGVLEKFKLSKAINIHAWISRLLYNSCPPDQKLSGPLATEEIRKQHIFWVKRVQKSCDLQDDYLQLNLQPNLRRILECR